jgi:IS1 family transposase
MGLWDKSRQIFNCRLFNPDEVPVVFRLAEKAEVDEMWSFVSKKHEPRWLWYVIDHRSGHILAHVFRRHKDAGFLKRKALLEPFGITHYYRRALRVHTHIISRQMRPSRANATRSRSSGRI